MRNYLYSANSFKVIESCNQDIQEVCHAVIKEIDCKANSGYRNEKDQNEAYANKASKVLFPYSDHNVFPSNAIDLFPYPVVFPDPIKRPHSFGKDLARWYMFGTFVVMTGRAMGIPLGWGADWNGNWIINDQTFDDLGHFYRIKPYKRGV